jgi:hypothetical protein
LFARNVAASLYSKIRSPRVLSCRIKKGVREKRRNSNIGQERNKNIEKYG